MTRLSRSTCRRLQALRQLPSVWEGDRCSLSPLRPHPLHHEQGSGSDCILWVDGSTAQIRAMEMVTHEAGTEAMVRVLLQAMEHPHCADQYGGPARPTKIIVRNREVQFFLRGILQDLGIVVTYAEELPIIDDIVRTLQSSRSSHDEPRLPHQYAEALQEAATQIWQDAPWTHLDDEKIIAIQLNYQDIDTLYLSFLGFLGVEFGVLMYRSQESLVMFRQQVMAVDEADHHRLEEVFLQQDCLFLTFEVSDAKPSMTTPWLPDKEIRDICENLHNTDINGATSETVDGVWPEFGTLHPLEGMRPILYEEEALLLLATLKALHQFLREYQHDIDINVSRFPAIAAQYVVNIPSGSTLDKVDITVSTMPELSAMLASTHPSSSQRGSNSSEAIYELPILKTDTVPSGTIAQLGCLPWDMLHQLRTSVKVHQPTDSPYVLEGEGLPIILLQTSRPKALALIEAVQEAGGVQSLGFTPSDDDLDQVTYDLGLFHTGNGVLHLFSEYNTADHRQFRNQWNERCRITRGYCGLIIAKGVTGAAKGNPEIKDMMALFETRSLGLR